MTAPKVDYDKDADVCYVNFNDPPLEADYTKRVGDIIFRSKGDKTIGITIVDFSKYKSLVKFLYSEFILQEKPEKSRKDILDELIYELDYYIKYEIPQHKKRAEFFLETAKKAKEGNQS